MATFSILTTNGLVETSGHVIREGKAKSMALLGIQSGTNIIVHVPSAKTLTSGYLYQSQAKVVAGEIRTLVTLSDLQDPHIKPDAFSPELRIYMCQLWLIKTPPTFEEWINGPDYEAFLRHSHPGDNLLRGDEAEYEAELQGWDRTIAWLPSEVGTMPGSKLRCLIEGRPNRR